MAGKTPKKVDPRVLFDEHSLLIAAFRYYVGRMTIATCAFADQLAVAWQYLRPETRHVIQMELDDAFERNDVGRSCDRDAWEKVRNQYRPTPPCNPSVTTW